MSRLECKGNGHWIWEGTVLIRICPDWNVKNKLRRVYISANLIRICPDWNVKMKEGVKPLN